MTGAADDDDDNDDDKDWIRLLDKTRATNGADYYIRSPSSALCCFSKYMLIFLVVSLRGIITVLVNRSRQSELSYRHLALSHCLFL